MNLVFKFHDDPTVNESEIVVFLRQVWWAAGKKKGFWEEKGKNENEENKRQRQCEKPSMLLFIARGIYNLLFTLFIYLLFIIL